MSTNFMKLQTTYIASAVTATVIVVAAYLMSRKKKDKVPENWQEVGILEKIYLYPLKSGRRIELEAADCTKVGIRETEKFDKSFRLRDRSLVVYSPIDNEYKIGKMYPKLLFIEVDSTDMEYITINAPDMRTLFVKIPMRGETEERDIVQFNHEKVNTLDCGDEAGQWISQYILGKDEGLRIGYNDGKKPRNIEMHKEKAKYYKNFANDAAGLHSDMAAIHLINQASIDDLNQRLSNEDKITALNFRPNFTIKGENLKPYEEDKWDWIKIGDVILRNAMECGRCVLTTINQDTAERNRSMEPLKTLKLYRIGDGPDKYPVMGAYLKFITLGQVKVGDKVYIGSQ
ncbi:mitochondrial amidoxime reducing component 2 [Aethina tumida]|uniref:mitochondrial amidoxime reducing component 2 n=1 Tax=Aethina tumida TaxID=116153 RepID=UPI002147B9F1|nr:mitochondrial amidoxime reducing component 2 [Aethina tumida]